MVAMLRVDSDKENAESKCSSDTCLASNNGANSFLKKVKENFEVQDYSFMTDQQLMELCGRLTSCQNWMHALHTQLLNEKAKLTNHGEALRAQIRLADTQPQMPPATTAKVEDTRKNIHNILSMASKEVVQVGRNSAIVTADVGIDTSKVLAANIFKDWVDTISKENRIEISKIHIQSFDMFGPDIGFIKFEADAKVENKEVPGIVFMRGGAVAILVILEFEGRQFTLLVRQPRVPVSSGNIAEIPTGMLDGNGSLTGVAAKEMKEEAGIVIKEKALIDMTHLAFRNAYTGVFPSCGSSDEFYRIFLFRKSVTAQELQDLNGKLTGVIEEGEMIKLQIIPLEALWRESPDAKALAALCLYRRLDGVGLLPKEERQTIVEVSRDTQPTELSIPEELLASIDSEGSIQLTWFYDEMVLESLGDATHPLESLSFQVKQQTAGLNGHLRTRFHSIPCSVHGGRSIEEQRFAPPGCIPGRSYTFSIRARARYNGEADERSSSFCEPVEVTCKGKAEAKRSDACVSEQTQPQRRADPPSLCQNANVCSTPDVTNLDIADRGVHEDLQQEEVELRKAMQQLQEEKAGFAADLEARMKAVQACQRKAVQACHVGTELWKRLGENRTTVAESSASSGILDGALASTVASASETVEEHSKDQQLDNAEETNETQQKMSCIAIHRESEIESSWLLDSNCRRTPVKTSNITILCQDFLDEDVNKFSTIDANQGDGLTPQDVLHQTPEVVARVVDTTPCSLGSSGTTLVCMGSTDISPTRAHIYGTSEPRTKSPQTICLKAEVQPKHQDETDCRVDLAKEKLNSATDSIPVCEDATSDETHANSNNIRLAVYRQAVTARTGCEGDNHGAKPDTIAATNSSIGPAKQINPRIHELLQEKMQWMQQRTGAEATPTLTPTLRPRAKSVPRVQTHLHVVHQGMPVQLQPQPQDPMSQAQMIAAAPTVSSRCMQPAQQETLSRSLSSHRLQSSRQYSGQPSPCGQPIRVCLDTSGRSYAPKACEVSKVQPHPHGIQVRPESPHPYAMTRRTPRCLEQSFRGRADGVAPVISQRAPSKSVERVPVKGEVTFTIPHAPPMEVSSQPSSVPPYSVSYDLSMSATTNGPTCSNGTPKRVRSPLWPEVYPKGHHCSTTSSTQEPTVIGLTVGSHNGMDVESLHELPKATFSPDARNRSLQEPPVQLRNSGAVSMVPIAKNSQTIVATTVPHDSKGMPDVSTIMHTPAASTTMQGPFPPTAMRTESFRSAANNFTTVFTSSTAPGAMTSTETPTPHVGFQAIPRSSSNSRSRRPSHPASLGSANMQLVAKSQIEIPHPRSNSRPLAPHAPQPRSNSRTAAEMLQPRSNSRPQHFTSGELPTSRIGSAKLKPGFSPQKDPQTIQQTMQQPYIMPGSLQTNAAALCVAPRSLSQDATSRSFNPSFAPSKNPLSSVIPPLVGNPMPTAVGSGALPSHSGQTLAQGFLPAFATAPGFQAPPPQFHFFASSEASQHARDQVSPALQPDDNELPPPPRSAPAASQHHIHIAELPPPPRVAPANSHNLFMSDEAPPPPRCAPASGTCGHHQGPRARGTSKGAIRPHTPVDGNSGRQFALNIQSSDDRWEKCVFSDSVSLDEQAVAFLQLHNLKSAFQAGLVARMHQMIISGQKQSSVDIVDLI